MNNLWRSLRRTPTWVLIFMIALSLFSTVGGVVDLYHGYPKLGPWEIVGGALLSALTIKILFLKHGRWI